MPARKSDDGAPKGMSDKSGYHASYRNPGTPMTGQNLPFDNRKQGLIRALLYPVLFERRIMDGVERALRVVIDRALGGTPDDYREAIRSALTGEAPLCQFGSELHSEQEIREYLGEIARRLEPR
jgi:hypothetical protein